jgi:hypothetical protein
MRTQLTTAVTACAGLALLAACGAQPRTAATSATKAGKSTTTRATTSPPPTTAGSTAVSAAQTTSTACTSAELTVSPGPAGGQGGMQKSDATFTLTNKGSRPCTLEGFPGVSFVTGDNGTQVGAPARRNEMAPKLVTLEPGSGVATLLLITNPDAYDAAECKPTDVRGLRIYPPGETAALFLEGTTRTCAGEPQGSSLLSVGPVGVTQ